MPPNIITPQEPPVNDQPKPGLEPTVINPPVANNFTPDISPQADNSMPGLDAQPAIEYPVRDDSTIAGPIAGVNQTVTTPTFPASSAPVTLPSSQLSQQPPVMPNTTVAAMNTDMLTPAQPEMPPATMPSAEMPPTGTPLPEALAEMPPANTYNNIANTPFVTPAAVNTLNTKKPKSRPSLSLIIILALIAAGIAGVIIWLVLK